MLTTDALLEPLGALTPSLFPDDDTAALGVRLAAYLADGYARADRVSDALEQDEAARQWAYYRAYDARYQAALAVAATASLDGQGSRTYTDAQVKAWGDRALAAKAAFDRLAPPPLAAGPLDVPARFTGGTRSVSHVFQW